jgi:hypothetical protein
MQVNIMAAVSRNMACLPPPIISHHTLCHACCSVLQTTTGYRVEVVTVRKLEFETDAFAFADKVTTC